MTALTGRRGPLAVAVVLLALPFALWLWEIRIGALPGERSIVERFFYRAYTDHTVGRFAEAVQLLGSEPVAALTVAGAMALVAATRGWRLALVVPAAASAALVARGLKAVLEPTPIFLRYAPESAAGGLPSGHAAYAAATFGTLAVLAWRAERRGVAVLALVPVVAMGPAMLVRGAHVPSDLLAGLSFGAGWALLVLSLAAGRVGVPSS